MKVISARVTRDPYNLLDPIPEVYVTTEDGNEEFLFDYYPEEISFTPKELIGLTIEECYHLKNTKYNEFLTWTNSFKKIN